MAKKKAEDKLPNIVAQFTIRQDQLVKINKAAPVSTPGKLVGKGNGVRKDGKPRAYKITVGGKVGKSQLMRDIIDFYFQHHPA